MGLPGLLDIACAKRKVEASDGYGGIDSTLSAYIATWRCRKSEDFSSYARHIVGQGGRQSFFVIGDLVTGQTIQRGDVLTISDENFEIMTASLRRTGQASHHWYLRVELMP